MNHSKQKIYTLLCVFLLALIITPAYAQNSKPLKARARFTNQTPIIDGKLTDPEWKLAPVLSNFIQVEPRQGEPSAFDTYVRLLYTNDVLYVGVFCADPLGTKAIRAPGLKRDFAWRDHDTFAIAIDTFNDQRNSISFATNPFGAQKDYLSFDDILFDMAWNGLWKVRTSRTDSGWVAEFEIPFKTLRYPDQTNKNQDWGINFLRLRRLTNEISAWSPYPRSVGFNRMEYAGLLENMEVPEPSSNLQVTPYFLISNDEMGDIHSGSLHKTNVKPGGNVKWAITPNTIFDFTINTDFAQAEADVQVANVNRFNVLFPEKRSFFLENASLFGPGLTDVGGGMGGNMLALPFFSRRIGLGPAGNPVPINAGIRAVHRSVERNFGFLYMHQQASEFEPPIHSAVGRYSKNIGKQSRIGVLGTMRAATEGEHYVNWLGAVDGFFRLAKVHTIKTMIMQSGYTDNRPSGFAGYIQYLYTTNTVKAWWTESLITEKFNPELGFVSRENVIATTPGVFTSLRGDWVPFKNYIRSFKPGIEMAWYHQASSGILTERNIKLNPFWVDLHAGGEIRYSVSWNYQSLFADFHPLGVGISSGIYNYVRHAFSVSNDPSRVISYSLRHAFGDFYGGRMTSTELKLTVAPIPQINLQLQLNHNKFSDIGSENTSPEVNLYTLKAHFALNPRFQLAGLYQRNALHKTDAFNIRFVWEYNPLSYVYLVFNSREFIRDDGWVEGESGAIIKLTYFNQF